MTTAPSSWPGLFASLVPAGTSDLRDTAAATTQQQKAPRTAFDISEGTSAVTLAVKPRQSAYKAGPGIVVLGSDASRRDADKRFGMRWSRI